MAAVMVLWWIFSTGRWSLHVSHEMTIMLSWTVMKVSVSEDSGFWVHKQQLFAGAIYSWLRFRFSFESLAVTALRLCSLFSWTLSVTRFSPQTCHQANNSMVKLVFHCQLTASLLVYSAQFILTNRFNILIIHLCNVLLILNLSQYLWLSWWKPPWSGGLIFMSF